MNESQVKNQTVAPGVDEAPMAVYPLNSSAKLDQEPNPFEKSFSSTIISEDKKESKLTLPPVAAITSPSPLLSNPSNGVIGGGILPKEVTNQFTWETLRTGPLSPSMLQGPISNDGYYNTSNANYSNMTKNSFNSTVYSQTSSNNRSRQSSTTSLKRSNLDDDDDDDDDQSIDTSKMPKQTENHTKKTDGRSAKRKTSNGSNNGKDIEDDEKRRNFLERNRIAALKCRQRKKQWLNNLQAKVEFLTNDNERLQLQSEALKEEIVNLKTLLLAHKDCPIAQANGFNTNSIHKGIPSSMLAAAAASSSNNNTSNIGFQTQSFNNNSRNSISSITSTSTTSTIPPQYQRPQQQQSSNVITGGTSSVIRF